MNIGFILTVRLRIAEKQYGAYCRRVASQILHSREDVQECLNEIWLRVWQAIPPRRPKNLKMYLASITRNLAYNMHRYASAKIRGGGQLTAALDELAECVTGSGDPEDAAIARELGQCLNRFLERLPEREALVIKLRYFHGLTQERTAKVLSVSQVQVSRIEKKALSSLRVLMQ